MLHGCRTIRVMERGMSPRMGYKERISKDLPSSHLRLRLALGANPFHPHSFSVVHLVSNYYVPETVVSIRDSVMNQRDDLFFLPRRTI